MVIPSHLHVKPTLEVMMMVYYPLPSLMFRTPKRPRKHEPDLDLKARRRLLSVEDVRKVLEGLIFVLKLPFVALEMTGFVFSASKKKRDSDESGGDDDDVVSKKNISAIRDEDEDIPCDDLPVRSNRRAGKRKSNISFKVALI